MAATYDQGLEPARNDYPEVNDPAHCAPEYVPPQLYAHEPIKPYGTYVAAAPYELSSSIAPSTFGGQAAAPPYNTHDQPAGVSLPVSQPAAGPSSSINSEKALPRRGKTMFGCTSLVFVLSCIIALLSMAVIGLAAATGIESHRANTNANKMEALATQLNSTSQASVEGPGVTSGSGSKSTSDSNSDSEPGTGTGPGSHSNSNSNSNNTGSKSTSDNGSDSGSNSGSGSNSDSDSESNTGSTTPGSGSNPGSTKTVTVSAAVTTETITVTPTSAISTIDDGCSEEPEKAHGSTYTSYKRFKSLKFTRYCQRDPEGSVLMVIFTSNFQQCMDACASYTTYLPENFPSGGDKTKCDGLSFIPEWADKAVASKENSKGNCYLKSGVKSEGGENGKKVKVHAAILLK
ncbi:hypothetical protein QBC36DRAFT_305886 [Triangularia setosa]|uniref:Uncharacterized protein n=1 Tax=Triangularia setosa TaxID=2587417 RepID=A0AAN6WHC5_9PEZI|nr:hypothetical protein QBC36DRAFT_305886 [Podospora setosa]